MLPDDLDVQRRGNAEIQRLADNVGREEIKQIAGKFAVELEAKLADVLIGRRMVLVQRNQDVGIARTDDAVVAVAGLMLELGRPMLSRIPSM